MKLFETHKIGGIHYPVLPPNVMTTIPDVWNGGRLGRSPLFGGRVPAGNGPLVRMPLGEFLGGEDLRRFGKAKYVAPARMVRPTIREFLKRGAGRLNFAFEAYEMFNDVATMIGPPPVITDFKEPEGIEPIRINLILPDGWETCFYQASRGPGMPAIFRQVRLWYPDIGFIGNNARSNPSANCATWGGGYAAWQEGYAVSPGGRLYGGIYTSLQYPRSPGWYTDTIPYWTWTQSRKGAPDPDARPRIIVTARGEVPQGERRTYPVVYPSMGPLVNLIPDLRPIGSPSGFPGPLPWRIIAKRKNSHSFTGSNGTRPPTPPYIPNPTRPPMGTKERKRRWLGMGVLAASKAALNTTLETCDAIDAVWSALPREVKWTPGLGRGKTCFDKGRDLYNNFHQLDIDQALVNLARMYAEDKLYGKVFQMTDAAGQRLSKHGMKIPGWKIDQPVMDIQNPFGQSALLDDIEKVLFDLIKRSVS